MKKVEKVKNSDSQIGVQGLQSLSNKISTLEKEFEMKCMYLLRET